MLQWWNHKGFVHPYIPEPMERAGHEKGMILVSPLNWGLGHATRVIPIIRAYQSKGYPILLGGNGASLALLREEFPHLPSVWIDFPTIRYSRNSRQVERFMLHAVRLLAGILREHKRLQRLARTYPIRTVISDNRLGLHARKTRNILITHQLQIAFPGRWRFFGALANRVNRYFIRKFDEVWVPDVLSEDNSLAGMLSQAVLKGVACKYIGLLTRFEPSPGGKEGEGKILVILGGPEPQRSILEKILITELGKTSRPVIVVAGNTCNTPQVLPPNIHYIAMAGSHALGKLIKTADLIVCRSGYSSIMDLVALGMPAVLIPTPGQPEQEYLAERMAAKGYFLTASQQHFHIQEVLDAWENCSFLHPKLPVNQFPPEL